MTDVRPCTGGTGTSEYEHRNRFDWNYITDLCQNVPRLKRTHVRTYPLELKCTQYKVSRYLGWIIAFN